MKHSKNINGSLLMALLPIFLVMVGATMSLLFPFAQGISILKIPILCIVFGFILFVISKWKKITVGDYYSVGPSSRNGLLNYFYKIGYSLIILGFILALIKLITQQT